MKTQAKKMKEIEKAVKDFAANDDIDESNDNVRDAIKTLQELRYAVAVTRQDYPDKVGDLVDCLISI